MDKHNAKDYLPLVQALAEGKTIQLRDWVDAPDLVFNYSPENYRIKPETVTKTQEMWMHPECNFIYPVASAEANHEKWEKWGWKRRIVTISYEE